MSKGLSTGYGESIYNNIREGNLLQLITFSRNDTADVSYLDNNFNRLFFTNRR